MDYEKEAQEHIERSQRELKKRDFDDAARVKAMKKEERREARRERVCQSTNLHDTH